MSEKHLWSHEIVEILPGKFHLESTDQNGCIFWCRRIFKTEARAKRYAYLAEVIMHSYDWLINFAEDEYAFYEKFWVAIHQKENLYRHWVIEIELVCNDLNLFLLDPIGEKIELPFMSLDDATHEDAIAHCKAEIDRIETGRAVVEGQLSLFN
jgi:hypothetical protein